MLQSILRLNPIDFADDYIEEAIFDSGTRKPVPTVDFQVWIFVISQFSYLV